VVCYVLWRYLKVEAREVVESRSLSFPFCFLLSRSRKGGESESKKKKKEGGGGGVAASEILSGSWTEFCVLGDVVRL